MIPPPSSTPSGHPHPSAPAEPLPAYPSRASGTMQGKPSIDGRAAASPRISFAPDGSSTPAPRASRSPNDKSGNSFTGRFSRASLRPSFDAARNTLRTVRQTLLSILPPLPMSKSAWYGPIATLGLLVCSLFGLGWWLWSTGRMPESVSAVLHLPPSPIKPALAAPPPPAAEEEVDPEVADVKFGRGSVLGGILAIPNSFAPAPDGAFDLIIHSHGNTDLAIESYEAVGTGAAVFVLNLGVGSGAYEDRFTNPRALDDTIERATKGVAARGIESAHVRRLAMVGWSAGYGSALRAIDHPQHADRVDAIVLLDGLHAGYRAGTRKIEPAPIAPMLRFAQRAVKGEKLLVITHSNIDPVDYLGVKETTDYILGQLGVERVKVAGTTPLPILRAMEGVLNKADMVGLEKRTEARQGGLTVRGYAGSQPTHHISHLMQMSQTALPLLVERWREVP
jgi:hypothetical protein